MEGERKEDINHHTTKQTEAKATHIDAQEHMFAYTAIP